MLLPTTCRKFILFVSLNFILSCIYIR